MVNIPPIKMVMTGWGMVYDIVLPTLFPNPRDMGFRWVLWVLSIRVLIWDGLATGVPPIFSMVCLHFPHEHIFSPGAIIHIPSGRRKFRSQTSDNMDR